MRSSRFSTLRARARRPLRRRLLSIVTSGSPVDGRPSPAGSARQWRSVLSHEKALFRSCEPEQCKRLFERLSTERTDRPDRPGTPPAADPLFNGMPLGYLNTGKIPANRADLRIGTRVRCGRITDFEDGC